MKPEWTPLLIVQALVAVLCITGLFVIAVLLFFIEPPAKNEAMINIVLGGIMTVGFANIVGFFFGQKEQGEQAKEQAKQLVQASGQGPVIEPPATIKVEPGA